jgi:hypothetical protein
VETYDLSHTVEGRMWVALGRHDPPAPDEDASQFGLYNFHSRKKQSGDTEDLEITFTADDDSGGPELLEALVNLDATDPNAIEGFTVRWGLLGLKTGEGEGEERSEPLQSFHAAVDEFQAACRLASRAFEQDFSEAERARLIEVLQRYISTAKFEVTYTAGTPAPLQCHVCLPGPLVASYFDLEVRLYEGKGYVPRICMNEKCGRAFLPDRSNKRFCSTRCANTTRIRNRRRQQREEGQP